MAKNGEPTVEVLNNSAYHTQREHVARNRTTKFRYPCVANVGITGEPTTIYYSDRNDKGHFGTPKLITSRFGITVFQDAEGAYGMTQDGTAIIDEPKNLEGLKKALLSPKFKALNKMTDVNGMRDIALNRKIIALFRRDFWKEFID